MNKRNLNAVSLDELHNGTLDDISKKAKSLNKVRVRNLRSLGRGGDAKIEIPESPLYNKGSYVVTNDVDFSEFAKAKARANNVGIDSITGVI